MRPFLSGGDPVVGPWEFDKRASLRIIAQLSKWFCSFSYYFDQPLSRGEEDRP